MAVISVKGGSSQVILDGSQDTLSLLAINSGTGLIHVGDPAPEGFDVPFGGGDRIILPANLSATLRADGFVVTGSIGQWGGQIYSGGGGGGELLPTQAIVDDGDTITATGGQTINVAVADNVPSLTVLSFPFWQPFTVTVADIPDFGGVGYVVGLAGSLTNQPVEGYEVHGVMLSSGVFQFSVTGPRPLADMLVGGVIGIGGDSYNLDLAGPWNDDAEEGVMSIVMDGDYYTRIKITGVPEWTVDQQVPIVIIPQNGG